MPRLPRLAARLLLTPAPHLLRHLTATPLWHGHSHRHGRRLLAPPELHNPVSGPGPASLDLYFGSQDWSFALLLFLLPTFQHPDEALPWPGPCVASSEPLGLMHDCRTHRDNTCPTAHCRPQSMQGQLQASGQEAPREHSADTLWGRSRDALAYACVGGQW